MAEPKRVALTQIGTGKPKEKKEKRPHSHRFTLSIVDTAAKTCPEYSYNELLKNALNTSGGDWSGDDDDPFSQQDKDEHDKLLSIAKSFEEKYGAPKAAKKKKKGPYNRVQEFVDLGDGYDETDPFIDNAEAYDELVPSCLTTQHGGFYINTGTLEFRTVSDSDDDFQVDAGKKKRKKHQIISDSESDADRPKTKGLKKKFYSDDDIKKKKRKKFSSASDGSEKPLLKRKKFDKDKFKGLKKKKKEKTVAELLANRVAVNGVAPPPDSSTKETDKPTDLSTSAPPIASSSLANLESAIDSVISQGREQDQIKGVEDSRSMSPVSQSASQTALGDEAAPKLPDNLPSKIIDLISQLKQAALESGEGKKKFFSQQVNSLLLDVENSSRQLLSVGTRTTVFAHLAAFLPCGKETLIKRAKKLRLDQHDDELREPISTMKDAINELMPVMVDRHQAEMQAVLQLKMDRAQDKQDGREGASTESDEEADNKAEGEKQKRIMAPRKKFEWTREAREMLNNLVRIKMEHYDLSKVRSQSPEEYLKNFLEQEVKPLWPPGWIQTRMLFNQCKDVHQRWTMTGSKPRKPLTLVTSGNKSVNSISAPTTPVTTGPVTSHLTATTTAMSNSTGISTHVTPSVTKQKPQSDTSASDSSCSSSASSNHKDKSMVDLTGENHQPKEKESKAPSIIMPDKNMASSTGSNTKPSVKSSGSFGFEVDKLTSSAQISQSAADVLRSVSAHVSKSTPESTRNLNTSPGSSTQSFFEKFYQFAAASNQAVNTVLAKKESHVKTESGDSSNPKQVLGVATVGPVSITNKAPISSGVSKPSSANLTSQAVAAKPHLAAALQGKLFSASSGVHLEVGHKPQVVSSAHKEKPQAKVMPSYQGQVVNQGHSPSNTKTLVHKLQSNSNVSVSHSSSQQSSNNQRAKQSYPVNLIDARGNAVTLSSQLVSPGQKTVSVSQSRVQSVHHKNSVTGASSRSSLGSSGSTEKIIKVTPKHPYSAESFTKSPGQISNAELMAACSNMLAANSSNRNVTSVASTKSNSLAASSVSRSAEHQSLSHVKRVSPSPQSQQQQKHSIPVSLAKPSGQSHSGNSAHKIQQHTVTVHSTMKPATFVVPSRTTPSSAKMVAISPSSTERVSSTSDLHSPGRAHPGYGMLNPSSAGGISHPPTTQRTPKQSPSSRPMSSSSGSAHAAVRSYAKTSSAPTTPSVSSTTSEQTFGGLTLSQIHAQTLKASQQAHIQPMQSSPHRSLPQYSPQHSYSSTSPSRTTASLPGYQGLGASPRLSHPQSSTTTQHSPEQARAAANMYGLNRSPLTVSQQAASQAHGLYQSLSGSPSSGLSPYGHHYADPSSQHRY